MQGQAGEVLEVKPHFRLELGQQHRGVEPEPNRDHRGDADGPCHVRVTLGARAGEHGGLNRLPIDQGAALPLQLKAGSSNPHSV